MRRASAPTSSHLPSHPQSEYIAERDARLGWLTGFTGSAGGSIPAALCAHPGGMWAAGEWEWGRGDA